MGNIILFYIIRSYNVYSHSLNVDCISACVLCAAADGRHFEKSARHRKIHYKRIVFVYDVRIYEAIGCIY